MYAIRIADQLEIVSIRVIREKNVRYRPQNETWRTPAIRGDTATALLVIVRASWLNILQEHFCSVEMCSPKWLTAMMHVFHRDGWESPHTHTANNLSWFDVESYRKLVRWVDHDGDQTVTMTGFPRTPPRISQNGDRKRYLRQ